MAEEKEVNLKAPRSIHKVNSRIELNVDYQYPEIKPGSLRSKRAPWLTQLLKMGSKNNTKENVREPPENNNNNNNNNNNWKGAHLPSSKPVAEDFLRSPHRKTETSSPVKKIDSNSARKFEYASPLSNSQNEVNVNSPEKPQRQTKQDFLSKDHLTVFFESNESEINNSSNQKKVIHGELGSELEQKISPSTQAKVTSTKHFLCEYWWGLFEYLNSRSQRLADLETKLESGNYTFMEKAKMKEQFFINESENLRLRRCKESFQDFINLARIGRGGYGNVFLVKHKKTNAVLAMKRVNKSKLLEKNSVKHIKTERDILEKTKDSEQSPWLVQGYCSFQDSEFLYFVMEYVPGGDLRTLIGNIAPFSENESKFYVVEMIYAVQALHNLGYIHRDLKPDNFLIDQSGNLKLADFGLSKKGFVELCRNTMAFQLTSTTENTRGAGFRERSRTFQRLRKELAYSKVGSPDYMAYELLLGTGYSFTVDWWSVGTILFELMCGVPPFFADTPAQVFSNIMNFETSLEAIKKEVEEADITFSTKCWNFIKGLICKPENRLGELSEELFKHPFFGDINWKDIRTVTAPFLPQISNEEDISYFDPPTASDEEKVSTTPDFLNKPNDRAFDGFTFHKSHKKTPSNLDQINTDLET